MKYTFTLIFALIISLICSTELRAQTLFSEGILTYRVTITPPQNAENFNRHSGTYVIMIKGRGLRKELQMENGFGNVMLYLPKKTYALREVGDKYIAIEISQEKQNEKNAEYQGFTLEKGKGKKNIAGFEGEKGKVKYKNGNTADIIYSTETAIADFVFDRFPGIKMLPLDFDVTNDDGSVMHFTLTTAEQKTLEHSLFALPPDSRIMTPEEYQQLK